MTQNRTFKTFENFDQLNFPGENSKFLFLLGIFKIEIMYLSIWGSKIKLTTLQGFPKVEFLDKKWRFGTACTRDDFLREKFSKSEFDTTKSALAVEN